MLDSVINSLQVNENGELVPYGGVQCQHCNNSGENPLYYFSLCGHSLCGNCLAYNKCLVCKEKSRQMYRIFFCSV
jgi:hypothetical protein